jgi:hypothetical protein
MVDAAGHLLSRVLPHGKEGKHLRTVNRCVNRCAIVGAQERHSFTTSLLVTCSVLDVHITVNIPALIYVDLIVYVSTLPRFEFPPCSLHPYCCVTAHTIIPDQWRSHVESARLPQPQYHHTLRRARRAHPARAEPQRRHAETERPGEPFPGAVHVPEGPRRSSAEPAVRDAGTHGSGTQCISLFFPQL